MSVAVILEQTTSRILVRRDSKDSCYSEEMSEDLSSTTLNSAVGEDTSRLSPLAPITLSRKSSTSDSAVSMDYEPDLYNNNKVNSLRRTTDQMMMDKLMLLEQRLKDMENMLKGETEKRTTLEHKVTKLEEENVKLVSLRTQAVTQLQSFSEKFFAMTEPKHISPVGTPPLNSPKLHSPRTLQSPRHSQLELRRISSNSSMGSSRLSGHSYTIPPPITSRYSNISL